VARVALEVVDSFWWKQQLRVKSAGSRTTALPSNEEASRQPLFDFASFLRQPGVRGNRFCNILYDSRLAEKVGIRSVDQHNVVSHCSSAVFDEEILP
jgi:hypothetical protein